MAAIRSTIGAVVAASLLVALAGCAEGPEPSPSASSAYDSGWVAPEPQAVAPLTGLPLSADAKSGPALAVKIPNDTYGARPQINLNLADQVYEELVEGGITRYVGIFQSQIPDVVGPIRSFRPMDPAIMHPYNPLVVYSGSQAAFTRLLRETGLKSFNEDSGAAYLSRLHEAKAPEKRGADNLVLSAQKLVKANSSAPAPKQIFAYSVDTASSSAVSQGRAATKLSVTMSPSSKRAWSYDASSEKWLRSQDGQPDYQYDSAFAKSRVTSTNVVIIRVDVDRAKYVRLHDSPPYTELFGSGKAYVATGGSIVEAKWSKGTRTSSPLQLVGTNGLPIRLAPGNTWFELVPNDYGSFSSR